MHYFIHNDLLFELIIILALAQLGSQDFSNVTIREQCAPLEVRCDSAVAGQLEKSFNCPATKTKMNIHDSLCMHKTHERAHISWHQAYCSMEDFCFFSCLFLSRERSKMETIARWYCRVCGSPVAVHWNKSWSSFLLYVKHGAVRSDPRFSSELEESSSLLLASSPVASSSLAANMPI